MDFRTLLASTSRFRLNNSMVRKPAAIHIAPASIRRQSRGADAQLILALIEETN